MESGTARQLDGARERPVNCSSCGFPNTAAARFCGGCGKSLDSVTSAASGAEHRQVCVLFCDLVGSTPLSHRMDPEDLRDLVGSFQRACSAVAFQHHGFVSQYRGDSIQVYFGYPHAYEDDASRAVRCALDMREAVRKLGNSAKLDLQVRVGIDSGRVVVGALEGSDSTERVAFGRTPNIAARVQAEAAPGEVVVTDALWRLLPSTFTAEPMGARDLKGVERPVELYRIVRSGGLAAGPNRPRTPFVGRVKERKRFREIWGRAKSEGPQFALLRGEPGIGKSRLIDMVRDEVAYDQADMLVARCSPVTTNTALYPVIELMGLRFGVENASAEELAANIATRMTERGIDPKEAVPLLASVLSVPIDPKSWPAPNLSPARARQRTMEIVVEAILALARRGPVFAVVEDLHWADASTIDLIRQLIQSRQSGSLLVLLTARPEFRPTWVQATNLTEIELEPLDTNEADTFIRKAARDKPIPFEVLWQIRERAAGNPLFLEEITRSVTESGALVEREHAWEVVGALSSETVPDSMEASLMARIDRLNEARPIFQLAATLGREFSHDLLTAVAQESEPTVQRWLDVILRSGLVYQLNETSRIYSFKHALVRDAAYDSLLRSTRQRHHARIAEVLVARFPEVAQNRPELLAHHFSGAGSYADAAIHWQAAGENAAKRSAMKEAVAHLRSALTAVEKLPEDAARINQELSALTALGTAQTAVHGWAAPEVTETCKRAIELARRFNAKERMYRPLWVLWTNQFVGGRLGEAIETAADLRSMGLTIGDPMLVNLGHDFISYTHYYRGEFDQAIAEAELGLRECTPEMDAGIAETFQISALCSMRYSKAGALWMRGQQDEGIAIVNDMIAYARSLRRPPTLATALGQAMFFSVDDRNWDLGLALADELFELSRAEGLAMWNANAGLHRGRCRTGVGQVERGVAEVLEWGALFHQTGSGVIENSVTGMVCEALHLAGRSEEALVLSSDGERRAKSGVVGAMMPELLRTRGNILHDLRRLDEADEAFRQAVACARAQGARSLELRALTSLLDLRLCRGQPGDLPAELRQSIAAMACRPGRPDLVAARDLLSRVYA